MEGKAVSLVYPGGWQALSPLPAFPDLLPPVTSSGPRLELVSHADKGRVGRYSSFVIEDRQTLSKICDLPF